MSDARNRPYWNASSDAYQAAHGTTLLETARAWGIWRIPESEVGAVGRVEGLDVLELGCGGAQWSTALARDGARATGIDLSERQLLHAARLARAERSAVGLVHGSAERLPFRAGSFDVVFCDHGAMTFANPERTVPEASRVLRPGGLFAFCMSSPIREVCAEPVTGRVSDALVNDYFGMSAIDEGDSVSYQLPYGAWIRLFRAHALRVEDLIELRPRADAVTTYGEYVTLDWARRWPAENIWKVRKERA